MIEQKRSSILTNHQWLLLALSFGVRPDREFHVKILCSFPHVRLGLGLPSKLYTKLQVHDLFYDLFQFILLEEAEIGNLKVL